MGNKLDNIKPKFESIITSQSGDITKATKELLATKCTDEEFRLAISPLMIRKAIEDKPNIFSHILNECVDFLYNTANAGKLSNSKDATLLNNCLRILTRIFPILHESKYVDYTQNFFWKNLDTSEISESNNNQFEENRKPEEHRCIAIKLMNTLMKLAFLPDYTVSTQPKDPERIWQMGPIKIDAKLVWRNHWGFLELNDKKHFYGNRIKVLECLLACLSSTLFNPLLAPQKYFDPWMVYVLSPKNIHIYTMVYSLLTFAISFEENGKLPYGGILFADESGERLQLLSIQILNLFFDFQIDENRIYEMSIHQNEYIIIVEEYREACEAAQMIKKKIPNSEEMSQQQACKEIFRNASLIYVTCLGDEKFVEFLLKHFIRLLQNPYDCENTFLPESMKKINIVEEIHSTISFIV
jgi:hypothetical protein